MTPKIAHLSGSKVLTFCCGSWCSKVPDSGVDFYYVSVQEAYLLMKNDKATDGPKIYPAW